jgi:hypothetical protein
MPTNSNSQESLFDTSSMATKHLEDPFAVVNRSIDPEQVAKRVEEPRGSLGKLGVEGLRQEIDSSVERTAELPGMTYAIAKGRELEQPTGSGKRATAAGDPESKGARDKRKSDLRTLGPTGQRIADKQPPDYFPYKQ